VWELLQLLGPSAAALHHEPEVQQQQQQQQEGLLLLVGGREVSPSSAVCAKCYEPATPASCFRRWLLILAAC
jgi:hypothetical protein